MSYWDFLQNNALASGNQEFKVICPKPRHFGLLTDSHLRISRCHMSHQAKVPDAKGVAELLDILLNKEAFEAEQSGNQLSSWLPLFSGSPPSRNANPLTQDVLFGRAKVPPSSSSPIPPVLNSPLPVSSACKGGHVNLKFGYTPAAIRIEGFDCLNRDSQHTSITAVA